MRKIYKTLSVLLSYPEAEWLAYLNELQEDLQAHSQHLQMLKPLFTYLSNNDLIELQENYVQLFDRTTEYALHLFEHIHGEERTRGQALVNLIEEYKSLGFTPAQNELPDYLPLFLELISLIPQAKAQSMLSEAIHVIAHIGQQLQKTSSVYTTVFEVLESLCPVCAKPLTVAPVRTMEEALIAFGTDECGIEPLLTPSKCSNSVQQQTIQFMKKMQISSKG